MERLNAIDLFTSPSNSEPVQSEVELTEDVGVSCTENENR